MEGEEQAVVEETVVASGDSLAAGIENVRRLERPPPPTGWGRAAGGREESYKEIQQLEHVYQLRL